MGTDFVTPEKLILSAACLAFGSLVQSVIGFGMGVVAIPLLVWGGFSLPEAIGMVLPNVLLQTAMNCWQNRRHLPWSDVGVMFCLRIVSIPLGVLVLDYLSTAGENLTRQILGFGVVGMLVVQRLTMGTKIRLPDRVGVLLAGVTSGFFAGLIGMGGPPLVCWVLGRGWSTDRQRSFLWLNFLLIVPVQILLMWNAFGRQIAIAMLIGIALTPLVLIIAWWGAQLGNSLSKERLRWMMQLFLLLIAARLIFWG
ncbi:MAG: sulfite exporter TauE/SafE family protein [Planctomycetaceae bacterium]|nr:sulfite exporter TauE/SafE family protein [Planctomycetaceae bacterium]